MKRFLPLLLLVLFATQIVFADGMVARKRMQTAYVDEVSIPDQRALIYFTNGVERLVIETRFTGQGSNFCWVVPTPSEPKIEEATTGLFQTLEFLLQPELVHRRTALFPGFTVAFILIYLLAIMNPSRNPRGRYLILPLLATIALGFYSGPAALLAFVFLAWAFHRIYLGEVTLLTVMVFLFFIAVLAGLLMPALSGAGMSMSTIGEVRELQRQRVGVFDVTTVDSKNPSALLDWLKENDFQAPAGASNVVADYVKEGWVFSVAKLSRETGDSATNAIHPLSFVFKTTKPVYPMRLTGVGTKLLKVELYVFGAGERAAAKNFRMDQCAPIVGDQFGSPGKRNELPLAHPQLKGWLQGSSVVTKLSAALKPAQMKEDVEIDWLPYSPYRPTVYSHKGAATIAADWAVGITLIAFVGILVVPTLRPRRRTLEMTVFRVLALGSVVFLVCFYALPKVEVRTVLLPSHRSAANEKMLQLQVQQNWGEARPATLAEAREGAARAVHELGRDVDHRFDENLLLGGSIHEEDSPGNYVIRQTTNGFEFIWFDAYGAEHSMDR